MPGRAGPVEWARLLGVGVQFLTRVPVHVRFDEGDLRRAAGVFPLVGVLVAGAGIAVRWALGPVVGAPLDSVVAVAATVIATGALHEDGFADAADGLWGGRDPEERLRIMRDSRLGTYGTLALVLLVATKLAALAPMRLGDFAATLVPAMVLGRASSLVLMRVISPAPQSVAALAGPPSPAGWVVAVVTSMLSVAGFAWHAWLPVAAAAVTTMASIAIVRSKVGSLNGDQLGATNQLVEISVLLSGAAVFAP